MTGHDADVQTWTSYPGLAAQTWYLTTDGRIAITGGTQCLDEGANGESLPILSFGLLPLASRLLHLSFELLPIRTILKCVLLPLWASANFQGLRLINVPLEIPIKVSPSIPRHLLTFRHLPPQLQFRISLPPSFRGITRSLARSLFLAHPPPLALLIHTSSLSLADVQPGPSSPKPQPHPLKPVSYPTSPRERSTPTPLLEVERGSIHMEGTISV